jgi:Arc-like DNA binding domain
MNKLEARVQVNVRIPASMKTKLQQIAAANSRSVSAEASRWVIAQLNNITAEQSPCAK